MELSTISPSLTGNRLGGRGGGIKALFTALQTSNFVMMLSEELSEVSTLLVLSSVLYPLPYFKKKNRRKQNPRYLKLRFLLPLTSCFTRKSWKEVVWKHLSNHKWILDQLCNMLQDKIMEKDSHRKRNQIDCSLKHVKCFTLKADKDDLIRVMKWHLAVAQIDGHLWTSLHTEARQTILIRVGRLTAFDREHCFRSSCALTHFIPQQQQPRAVSSSHTRQREAYVLHLLGFPPGCICSPTPVHRDGEPLLPQEIRGR